MYFIPSDLLTTVPKELAALLTNKNIKAVLVLTDGNHVECFAFNQSDTEANFLLDQGKNRILNGYTNYKGRGPVLD
jgi:hypothetical protein